MVMSIISKNNFIVTDKLRWGLRFSLCARNIITLHKIENEIAIEMTEKPHGWTTSQFYREVYMTFLVLARMYNPGKLRKGKTNTM